MPNTAFILVWAIKLWRTTDNPRAQQQQQVQQFWQILLYSNYRLLCESWLDEIITIENINNVYFTRAASAMFES